MEQEMQICKYRKEAEMFEELLNERCTGLGLYTWTKEEIPKTDNGWKFTIKAYKGLEFYFIGKEFMKRLMRYHLEHYAFIIHEDID